MTYFFKKCLLLSVICIFSISHVHPRWRSLSSSEITQPYLPSIATALGNEFDRILDPAHQQKKVSFLIEDSSMKKFRQLFRKLNISMQSNHLPIQRSSQYMLLLLYVQPVSIFLLNVFMIDVQNYFSKTHHAILILCPPNRSECTWCSIFIMRHLPRHSV